MRLYPLVMVVLLGRAAAAQTAPGTTVSGVVLDSVAHVPLAEAKVQLAAADNPAGFVGSAETDSLGRFTITDVPDGRYMLGFFHPMLDSLGVDAPLREVNVAGHRPVRADLAIPSPARLRGAICGSHPATDSSAVVVGTVRDARNGAPAAGVTVTGEWLEYSLSRTGLVRRMPRLTAKTGENGWFAICNVPNAGNMTLIASRGADSTDIIELQIPADGFMRRELYLAPAQNVVTLITRDTTHRADSLSAPPRRTRSGNGRLSGTVVTVEGGRPLPRAQVGIIDGPQTRTNDRGEWTLVDAPVGTRMLEVRALGYYPDHRAVNVVPSAGPVRVALSTLKAMLDTVRITATRLGDRHDSGFMLRRNSGMGRYLTAADIARRGGVLTSDVLQRVSGVRVYRNTDGTTTLLVRGTVDDWCAPAIYLDGRYVNGLGAEDIDDFVRPDDIGGIEVYSGISAPIQFQPGMSGCGSIVIWRK